MCKVLIIILEYREFYVDNTDTDIITWILALILSLTWKKVDIKNITDEKETGWLTLEELVIWNIIKQK